LDTNLPRDFSIQYPLARRTANSDVSGRVLLIDYNLFQIVNDKAFFISVNRCLLLTGYESVPMSESASLFRNLVD